jgi:hypothetical protein
VKILYFACIILLNGNGVLLAGIPWTEARARLVRENELLARRPQGHAGTYFVICTVFYTPMESGFTAQLGFDMTPVTASGLREHVYPREFLATVKKEGFGRITTPVDGLKYIRYNGGGEYRFAAHPTGRGANVLMPRSSAAARKGKYGFAHGTELTVLDDTIISHRPMANRRYRRRPGTLAG